MGGPSIQMSFGSGFACFAYAAIPCHALLAPRRTHTRRALLVLLLAVVLAGAVVAAWEPALRADVAKATLAALGAVGLAQLLYDVIAEPDRASQLDRLRTLRDALIVPIAVLHVPFFLWTNALVNPVYDARVYAFDAQLAVPLAYWATGAYVALDPLSMVATASYLAMPLGLTIAILKQPQREAGTRLLLASIVAGVAGFLLYRICPVVGPFQAFAIAFPAPLPDVAAVGTLPMHLPSHVPRNGMPSLHTAWALLLLFNVRGMVRPWRAAIAAFAALNICAAIGHYQHWFIDLIVAVPFAAAIQLALVRADPAPALAGRLTRAAVQALLVLGWVVGLREGWLLGVPTWLSWVCVGVTLVLAFASVRRPARQPGQNSR